MISSIFFSLDAQTDITSSRYSFNQSQPIDQSTEYQTDDFKVHQEIGFINVGNQNLLKAMREKNESLYRIIYGNQHKPTKVFAVTVNDIITKEPLAYMYCTNPEDGKFSLDGLYVAPKARNKGIGTQLCHLAERQAMLWGKDHVQITTFAFQAPLFYSALGYTKTGEINGTYDGINLIYFEKKLNSKTLISSTDHPQFVFEMQCIEYNHPADFFNASRNPPKAIFDKLMSLLTLYNITYMDQIDAHKRNMAEFSIMLMDPRDGTIEGIALGYLLMDFPLDSYLIIEELWIKEENQKHFKGLSEALKQLGHEYCCKMIKVGESSPASYILEKIGFSATSQLKLQKDLFRPNFN